MHKKSLIVYFGLLLAISGLMYTNGTVLPDQRDAWTNEAGSGVNAEAIETRLVGTSSYPMAALGDAITTSNDEILSTSGPIEMTSESIVTTTGTFEAANFTSPPQTFEEWRNFLLAWNNMTADDLENADPITIQTLDREARIYEGWMNGTYTDEQKSQLFAELHQTPTVEYLSIPSSTDGNFEYSFHVYNLIFGEHTFRVYVYMTHKLYAVPSNWFWDQTTEKVYGPYGYDDPYPYEVIPYLPETDPSTSFMGPDYDLIRSYFGEHGLGTEEYTGSKQGLELGDYYLVVQILYRGDEFIPWTFTYKAHFFWVSYTFDVTIVDDDITPPIINGIYIFPLEYDPLKVIVNVIPDNQEYFVLCLDVTDASSIEPVILFNGQPCLAIYGQGNWWEFLVRNPRTPGINYGLVLVWDADYDRPGDRLFTLGACAYFIYDDDVNPPEVSLSTMDIKPYGDMIQLSFTVTATDARGIGSVVVQIGDYLSTNLGTHNVILPPGLYTLHISVTDADYDWQGDSMTTVIDLPLVLDLAPPRTELIFDPRFDCETGCYVTSETEYTLHPTDDFTGVANTYYQINGGPWMTYTTGFTLSGPDGYVYTISYYSVDNNGNIEQVKTQTVIIDNTAPVTKLTASGTHGFGNWYVSDIEVTLSSTDGLSGVAHTMYSLDGSNWIEYTGPFAYGFEGDTILYYRSIDNLGNAENVKAQVLNIDCTAPETTISLSGTEGLEDWYVSDVTVTLSATDTTSGVARIMYSFDGITWYSYYYPVHTTTLTIEVVNGQHCKVGQTVTRSGDLKDCYGNAVSGETINIYMKTEEFGNWAYVSSCATDQNGYWQSSITAPAFGCLVWFRVEFAGSAAYEGSSAETAGPDYLDVEPYYQEPPIIIIGSIDFAATASISCTSTVLDSPGPFTITDEGVTTVYYYSVDAAGNQEDQKTAMIKIDKTAPETTESHTGTEGLGGWYTSDVTVTLEATDPVPGSGLARTEYSYDGENWMTYTSFLTLTSEGSTTIYYRSVDIAGNTETAQSIEIWIDKTPPTTTSALEGEHGLGDWFTSDVTVTLSAADPTPGSSLAYTEYSLDLITWTRYETPFIISYRDITTVYYRSVDNAGNTGQTESVQVKIYIASQTAIGPATLNLKSKGQWVTLYIQLPQDYSADEIIMSSFELRFGEQVIQASWGEVQDGLLMLKFDRAALIDMLSGLQPDTVVQLELWGEVAGSIIAGTVTVRVI